MTGDDKTVERFEAWGLLELMGHQRLAGRISDQTIGGVHFLRIDVPAVDDVPQYSRFVTQQAIYGMTVLAEGVARRLAASLRARPVAAYDLAPEPEAPALPAPVEVESDGPENPGFDMAGVECGKTYEGKVTRVLDFGALIEILPGVEGLLHISQIAHHRVDNVADYLAEGQGVTVKVIETDERGRIKLSMKALLARVPAGHDDDGLPF